MDARNDFCLSYSVTFLSEDRFRTETSRGIGKPSYPWAITGLLRKTWDFWLQVCSDTIVGEKLK